MPKSKSTSPQNLTRTNPGAAAIDIGSTMHMAAVNPDLQVIFGDLTLAERWPPSTPWDLHQFRQLTSLSRALKSVGPLCRLWRL